MDTVEAARRWADAWRRGWAELDPAPILDCYADAALLSTAPFREPYRGRQGVRAYVTQALNDEADPRVWFDEPIVDGDRAAVCWWSSLREAGTDATLAGTSVLRFDRVGLVVEQWDTWHQLDSRRDPPQDWSPFRRDLDEVR